MEDGDIWWKIMTLELLTMEDGDIWWKNVANAIFERSHL